MSVSFLSPNRTVLLVSDDALYIYTSGAGGVRLISSVPWGADDFEPDVARILVKDCKKRPVLILNDMVEQHYRKERVIKKGVGLLDRSSMLERKLQFAFPNYPVRAAMPLKEKIKKSETVAAADVYIFAAIPNSEQFKKTLAAVNKSFVSISSVCLLPVESADLVKTLSDKLEADKPIKSKWAIFVSQHQSGGLRQIVTKDGEIALTRMTPMASMQDRPEEWASEVQTEFSATMSYVSRFGYQPEDGINVIIVGDALASRSFQSLIEENYDCYALTPEEAAKKLGVSLGRQDPEGQGNFLHIAWAGRKSKFTLPLKAPLINRVSQPRKVAMAASFLLFCSFAFYIFQVFSSLVKISTDSTDLEDKKAKYSQVQLQLDKEIERKNELGIDIKLVQSSIKVHDVLESKRINALNLFKQVGKALGKDLRIDFIEVTTVKPQQTLPGFEVFPIEGEQEKKPVVYQANMRMSFPTTADLDQGNLEIQGLHDRLAEYMPGDDVDIVKSLGDYGYANEIEVSTGTTEKEDVQQDFIAEIQVKGREK